MGKAIQADVYDEDVVQIFKLLQQWHSERVEKLQSIVDMPDEHELELKLPDGRCLILDGAKREWLQSGIEVALMMLGKLPFRVDDIPE
jgi:hypothetical protein